MRKKLKLTIRQRVRVYLAERDMTQQQLADALGMSGPRLSVILSGKATPNLDEAFRIENVTGIAAREFTESAA